MRLLVVSNLYPPQELGGYGRSLADFAWGLQRRGHELAVLCADAPYLGPSDSGPNGEPAQRLLRLKGSFEGGVSLLDDAGACTCIDQHNASVVRQVLARGRYSGILLGNLDLLGAELLQPLLEPGIPLLHHVGFMTPPFEARQWPKDGHYQLVAASLAVREALAAAGLPVAASAVVYPGARMELFGRANQVLNGTSPLGTPANPLKVCFAGLLMGSKGAHTLVEAAALLHQNGVALQLNLAGAEFQAGYWQQLNKLATQTGLADRLSWLGPLDRSKLARYLQLHHVGVFPSIYPEAFGIVGAEMLASGLALVSSGVGGAAELLEDGVSGLRFEPGNSADLAQQLLRLVEEPGLLERLQAAGQERVRKDFSVAQAAQQLEALWGPTHSGIR